MEMPLRRRDGFRVFIIKYRFYRAIMVPDYMIIAGHVQNNFSLSNERAGGRRIPPKNLCAGGLLFGMEGVGFRMAA
jgi:hypothetical protein